ncbi:metallophosphoesterase [Sunxiuqinia elliptica]
MRGIPGSGVFIFFAIVFLIELLAFFAVRHLLDRPRVKKQVTLMYWLLSFLMFAILLLAFLNPDKIRETTNYQFFYFVISVSFLNLLPKIILAVGYLLSIIPRLFRSFRISRVVVMSSLIIGLGVVITIGYSIAFGRKTLRIEKHEIFIKDLPAELDQTILLQFSDTHLGSFETDAFFKRTVEVINQQNADVLLFTGDMVNNYYQEMEGFEDELANMKAKYGKFAILGNHDYGDYSNWENDQLKRNNHQQLCDKIEQAGFQLLQNESAAISINHTPVEIIGVENWGHAPFPQYADLNKALKDTKANSLKVLLSHDPAHWEAQVIDQTEIPLMLSGHTHAAQTGLRIAGIEFSPMYFVQKYWGGLYQRNDQYLYVNRGFGCVGFLGRIDMAPEITVLTLRSK